MSGALLAPHEGVRSSPCPVVKLVATGVITAANRSKSDAVTQVRSVHSTRCFLVTCHEAAPDSFTLIRTLPRRPLDEPSPPELSGPSCQKFQGPQAPH